MIARTAHALCVAARWPAAASLVLTGAALVHLSESRILLAAVVVAGAVQTYLAFRIEFDRVIFEAIAYDAGSFESFDAALAALGMAGRSAGRPPAQRVAGLRRLLKCSGIVCALQFALAVAAILNLQ